MSYRQDKHNVRKTRIRDIGIILLFMFAGTVKCQTTTTITTITTSTTSTTTGKGGSTKTLTTISSIAATTTTTTATIATTTKATSTIKNTFVTFNQKQLQSYIKDYLRKWLYPRTEGRATTTLSPHSHGQVTPPRVPGKYRPPHKADSQDFRIYFLDKLTRGRYTGKQK